MIGIFGLVQNENMKIYYRLRTWIFYAILLAAVIITGYLLDSRSIDDASGTWQQHLQQETQNLESQLNNIEAGLPDSYRSNIENQINLNKYAIQHNINPMEENAWSFVNTTVVLGTLVTLFVVIIASDMIAGETATGTIKMLLIRPHKRWKILLSKYIATILFAIIMIIFLFTISWLIGNFIYGFGSLFDTYLTVNNAGEVQERLMLVFLLQVYGLEMIRLVIIVTLAFMISTIFNSNTFAVGTSIVVLLAGSGIALALSKYSWVKFTLFANLDLRRYLDYTYNVIDDGMSLPFSLTILFIYFILMVAITWGIFINRDVKA